MTGPQAIEYIEYDELAENMYEKIRNSNDEDIKKISKNMNWDEDKIKLIKEHVFIKEYNKLYNWEKIFKNRELKKGLI